MEFLCLPANPPKATAALVHFTPGPDAAAQWSCQLAAPMDSDDLHCCDEDLSGIPLHSPEDNSRLPNTTDDEEEEDNATSKQESHLTNSNKLQKKDNSLYALRRNPKRSRRFIDQEYALDISVNSSGPSPALPAPKKNSSSMFADKARACTECGKEFSSWKALFGHMRCHPEREWRGIQRPDNLSDYKFAKSSGTAARRKKARQTTVPAEEELEAFYIKFSIPSDDSDTESIEAAYINGTNGFHSTRPKIITGKRSKRLPKTSLTTTTTTASEERDMARCLVMLAQHKSSSSLSFEEESDQEGTSTTNNNNHVASTNENNPVSSGEMDNEQLVAGTSDTQQQQRPHLEHYQPPLDDMCTPTELLEHDLDGIRMKYECSTCKRIFKSHQALGGHRASHKKVKGCFAKTNSPLGEGSIVPIPSLHQQHLECTNEEDLADEDFLRTDEQILPMDFPEHHLHLPLMPSTAPHTHLEALTTTLRFKDEFESTTSRKMSNIKGHECSICHRVFTSGQALGGHKRCHWGGSEQRPIPEQSSVVKPMTEQPSLVKPITHFMSHVVGDIAGILNSSTNTKLAPGASLGREEFLDLNLPAMVDDECEHREHRKEEGSGKSISAAALEVIHKLPQLLPMNNLS